ncbi:MAG: hypothetical protein NC095_05130 [Muribaculum sp.]|nr:hypothetical protein [Muribaculum sp.]
MSHDERKDKEMRFALHLGFDIAKIVLKAAMVAAAFCAVKEVHKVHKAIEERRK